MNGIAYIIVFLLIVLLIFAGCGILFKNEAVSSIETSMQIKDYKYNGHDYIIFVKGIGDWQSMGIEHNPDCNCFKKQERDEK